MYAFLKVWTLAATRCGLGKVAFERETGINILAALIEAG